MTGPQSTVSDAEIGSSLPPEEWRPVVGHEGAYEVSMREYQKRRKRGSR
jgi:hypothetical protein